MNPAMGVLVFVGTVYLAVGFFLGIASILKEVEKPECDYVMVAIILVIILVFWFPLVALVKTPLPGSDKK